MVVAHQCLKLKTGVESQFPNHLDLLSWISENLSTEHSAPKISLNTSINDVGDTLEAFIANRLIPLKKSRNSTNWCWGSYSWNSREINNGYCKERRPISIRIFTSICGPRCGYKSPSSTQCTYNLFQQDEIAPVLLADAENAFNYINEKAMLHSISIMYPILSTFV